MGWTRFLCEQDSDGDGQSNGLELGDPHCMWRPGDEASRSTDISHPGFGDSKTDAQAGPPPPPTAEPTPMPTPNSSARDESLQLSTTCASAKVDAVLCSAIIVYFALLCWFS